MILNSILEKLAKRYVREATVITNPGGQTIWVNDAFYRLSVYTLVEVRGQKPGNILQGKNTSKRSRELLAKAIREKQSREVEVINYSKNGSELKYVS